NISGLKVALQIKLLRKRLTTLAEAFSLARITEARFEDERSTTAIAKPNYQSTGIRVQDLEETIRHKPNKVEVVKTSRVATSEEHEHQEKQDNLNEISKEKDDVKPSNACTGSEVVSDLLGGQELWSRKVRESGRS
nr:hypothetical protein [Tanacetum cinerariifolium]